MRRLKLLIVGIALLYLVAIRWSLAAHGILTVDNARDLAIAWRIVHAQEFPLVGPMQTGLFHLGPLYSYLLAIPLALFGTATSLTFFISLLSLIGLYFGYKLGELLFDREVGLVFAALLGSDFMANVGYVQPGHSGLIIPATLACLYAAFSAILRREARFVGWGLIAAAVALQTHLAVAAVLPLVAIPLFLPMNGNKARSVTIGLTFALVLFLPYLAHQAAHGLPDIRRLPEFFRTSPSAALGAIPFTSVPRLFLRYNGFSASMATGFSQFVASPWVRALAVGSLRLVSLASLLGLALAMFRVFRHRQRTPYGLVLAWLMLGWFIIPFLRPSLQWYVLFPVYPAHLLLASLAVVRLGRTVGETRAARLLPYALVGAVFLWSPFLMAQTFARFAQQGRLQIAGWLMRDLLHEPAASPGTFVMPYLGTRQEERMIRRLTSLPEADTTIYQRIHGIPLWSTIFSRTALFWLHPPPVSSGAPSPYHVVGLLQTDLPGRPVGEVSAVGPMVLIRSLPSIVYQAARYSYAEGPRWYAPGYDDTGWKRISLPGYAVPNPLQYPPWNYPRSMSWERRPVRFRIPLAHQTAARTLLGVSFPTFGLGDEEGRADRLYLNGVEVGHPHLRTEDLLLYDITPHLRRGNNLLALAVDGGPHFILDLFTVSLER